MIKFEFVPKNKNAVDKSTASKSCYYVNQPI